VRAPLVWRRGAGWAVLRRDAIELDQKVRQSRRNLKYSKKSLPDSYQELMSCQTQEPDNSGYLT
jgi:hypothetical protein